jgi:acetamidase/formamidase
MMKLSIIAVLLCTWTIAFAQTTASDINGDWTFMFERQKEKFARRLQLSIAEGKIEGKSGNTVITGLLDGSTITLEWRDPRGNVEVTMTGKYENGRLSGTGKSPDGFNYTWVAEREAARPAQPRTHEFSPTEFQRYFTAATSPVLRINPGDTVHTWSVDAGGTDPAGQRRSIGGNPLTGPFFVEGAFPGDTLVVRLKRVRINRDWAQSGTGIVQNAVSPDYSANLKRAQGFGGRWRLDAQNGSASLTATSEALKNFRVPIDPMLGCVAVAPPGQESISTRDSGNFGGNMDYNRIREGTTVYLPVYQLGALLLVGDGHAAQGDGELTGDALETSMEIEFSVDLLRGFSAGIPYAEDNDYWMAIGIAGSLDEALRRATTGMARYLESEHGLNSNEAAVVMGFAVKYDIADLVGTQVGIVAKLPKTTIAQLPPRKQR